MAAQLDFLGQQRGARAAIFGALAGKARRGIGQQAGRLQCLWGCIGVSHQPSPRMNRGQWRQRRAATASDLVPFYGYDEWRAVKSTAPIKKFFAPVCDRAYCAAPFGTRPIRWNSSFGRIEMTLAIRFDKPKNAVIAAMSQMSSSEKPCSRRV